MANQSYKEIFLSYAHKPEVSEFVSKLMDDLESERFTVWRDTTDVPAGAEWHGELGVGVGNCKALIPVITPKYVNSPNCTNELYMASEKKKLIFPVFRLDTNWSSSEIAQDVMFTISRFKWTMMREGKDNYSVSLRKLIDGLRKSGLGPGNAHDSVNGEAISDSRAIEVDQKSVTQQITRSSEVDEAQSSLAVFDDEVMGKDIPYLPCKLIHDRIEDGVTELHLAGVSARYSSGALPVNTKIRMLEMPIKQGYSFKGVTFSSQVIVGPHLGRRLKKPLVLTFRLKVEGKVTALVSPTAAEDTPKWEVIPESSVKIFKDRGLVEVTTYQHCRHGVQSGPWIICLSREVAYLSVVAKLQMNTHHLKVLCSDDRKLCMTPSGDYDLCHKPVDIKEVEMIHGDEICLTLVSDDRSIKQLSCLLSGQPCRSHVLCEEVILLVEKEQPSSPSQKRRCLTCQSYPVEFSCRIQLPTGYGEGCLIASSKRLKAVDSTSYIVPGPPPQLLFSIGHPPRRDEQVACTPPKTSTSPPDVFPGPLKRKPNDDHLNEIGHPMKVHVAVGSTQAHGDGIARPARTNALQDDELYRRISNDIFELHLCTQLAILLGVCDDKVVALTQETRNPCAVAFGVLKKWSLKEEANRRVLYDALSAEPFDHLARKYKSNLLQTEQFTRKAADISAHFTPVTWHELLLNDQPRLVNMLCRQDRKLVQDWKDIFRNMPDTNDRSRRHLAFHPCEGDIDEIEGERRLRGRDDAWCLRRVLTKWMEKCPTVTVGDLENVLDELDHTEEAATCFAKYCKP